MLSNLERKKNITAISEVAMNAGNRRQNGRTEYILILFLCCASLAAHLALITHGAS